MSYSQDQEPISVTLYIKGSKIVQVLDSKEQSLPPGDYKIRVEKVIVERGESNI